MGLLVPVAFGFETPVVFGFEVSVTRLSPCQCSVKNCMGRSIGKSADSYQWVRKGRGVRSRRNWCKLRNCRICISGKKKMGSEMSEVSSTKGSSIEISSSIRKKDHKDRTIDGAWNINGFKGSRPQGNWAFDSCSEPSVALA